MNEIIIYLTIGIVFCAVIFWLVKCINNEHLRKNTKLRYTTYWHITYDGKEIFKGTEKECKEQMYIIGHDYFFYEINPKVLTRNIQF